ncbi:MAG: hypothetical protein AAB338_01410 [Patescibacteria group bacterium]
MSELRPFRYVLAKTVKDFFDCPLERGSRVLEGSKKLYEEGFPARFVRNFHVEHRLAEVHLHEDDVFFCMYGSVRFVLGGRLVDPWTKNGLTFLADSIEGGEEVVLSDGDWLHIPAGQAHQHFTSNFCHLMVVKTAPPEGKVRLEYLEGIEIKT